MWIIKPVLIITLCRFCFSVEADTTKGNMNSNSTGMPWDITCKILHPLMYAIICFLAAVVFILLILLFKIISMQNRITRDTIQITSNTGESTSLHQNNVTSCNGGADNSSSTSSGTPGGSISSNSRRYVSLQERSIASDYINVSEGTSSGRVDFKNKTTHIDYVNVKESQRRKVSGKGQVRCADATSLSSDTSDESTVNYSKVVFTKTEK